MWYLTRSNFCGALVIVCLVAGGVLASTTHALAGAQGTFDDRVYAIARGLMCPTCAGQTVAESNAPLAAQMREEIRVRLRRGEGPEEIRAFFVSQFGESVLATPPRRGVGLVMWFAPILALVFGLVALSLYLRRIMRPGAAEPSGESR